MKEVADKRGFLGTVSDTFGILKDVLVPALTMGFKQNIDQAMRIVSDRVRHLQAQLLRALVVWSLVFFGVLGLAASTAFLLVDYAKVSWGVALLGFSAVTLLIALVLYTTRPSDR